MLIQRRGGTARFLVQPARAASAAALLFLWSPRARAEEAPTTSAAAPAAEHETAGRGHFAHLGVLGGVGFPRPLAIEGLVGIADTIALGAEYSFMPNTTISGVDTRFWALAADARFFPFGGAFFLGARAGHQHLAGSTTVTVAPFGAASGAMAVDTWFLNPRAGFLFMWQSGLALGIDAGIQLPIASSESTTIPAGLTIDPRVTRVTDTLGKSVVPTIDLLQVGIVL
jgi:hypothetical protein